MSAGESSAGSQGASAIHGTLSVTINQPFSQEAEQRAIGLVIQWPRTWPDFQKLAPEDFFFPVNGRIWSVIRDLRKANKPCDLMSVTTQLSSLHGGVEGTDAQTLCSYVTDCVGRTLSYGPQNHQETARLLIDRAERRGLARTLAEGCQKLSRSSLTDSPAQLASEIIRRIQTGQKSGSLVHASELIREIRNERFQQLPIYSTGWSRLDRAMGGGLVEREYSVLGGRMGSFKTMAATSISFNLIHREVPVPHDYYCLEQTGKQMLYRILARQISEIYFQDNGLEDRVEASIFRDIRITSQNWFGEALEAAEEWCLRRGLRFLRQPRMDLNDLVSEISSAGLEGHAKGIIVDYVQLVRTPLADKGLTTAHLDQVHQTLAELCTNNPLWILGLVQMNQTGGVRGGEGAMAAASNVCYLHKVEDVPADPEEPMTYRAWIEVAKNRHSARMNVGGPGGMDPENMDKRLPDPAYILDGECGPCLRELPDPRRQAA